MHKHHSIDGGLRSLAAAGFYEILIVVRGAGGAGRPPGIRPDRHVSRFRRDAVLKVRSVHQDNVAAQRLHFRDKLRV